MGEVDISGADRFTGLAVQATLYDCPCIIPSVVEEGENKADGTDIDVTEGMTADHSVDRAYVGTGTAADALQGLAENRIFCKGLSAVIQKDNVLHLGILRRRS